MKYSIFSFLFLISVSGFSQEINYYKYFVRFTDKKGSPYSIQKPEEYLSQRALDRRKSAGIKIDETDLPVNPQYVAAITKNGISKLNTSKWLNGVSIQLLDTSSVAEIRKLPFVLNVSMLAYYKGLPVDNEKLDSLSNSLDELMRMIEELRNKYSGENPNKSGDSKTNTYGNAKNQIEMLGGIKMHEMGYKGQGMVIAVLDAGFRNADKLDCFKSLFANKQVIATWDFVKNESSVYEDDTHGLMVLSCMAANDAGIMVGTAPAAQYLLLRTEDAATEFPIEEANWVSGAEYADSAGADIINSSLGYTEFDDKSMGHQFNELNGNTALSTIAADIAASKGMIVVNSAGNEGNSKWRHIGAPADADSILSVGAVDGEGTRASFSSQGPTFDKRIKPTISAQGEQCFVASAYGGYTRADGTSFSSPITAGMVACLWQANRNKTNFEIMNAIIKSGHLSESPDTMLGYGIPDYTIASYLLGGKTSFDTSTDQLVRLTMNRFTGILDFTFFSSKTQTVELKILNKKGKLIAKYDYQAIAGNFLIKNISDLKLMKPGLYKMQIATSGKVIEREVERL